MGVQGEIKQSRKIQVREPRKFHVIMHNDDYTTMEFVVEVLMDIFHRNKEDAVALMMTVHKNGSAVVGEYSYDIASSKIRAVSQRAEREGYPLRMTLEEA